MASVSQAQWQHALAVTAVRLAGELGQARPRAPAWGPVEWRAAMAVAVMHGISGLLARQLHWQGSPLWRAFLEEQLQHSRQREQRIVALLGRLDGAARQAGLPVLALKGSALLRLQLYRPGERPMSDIDLLVRPRDRARADAVIRDLGYHPGLAMARHDDYRPAARGPERPFGEHAASPIKLELHTRILERLPLREAEISAALWPQQAGVQPYPSRADLMRHLLLHAAGNLCGHTLRLIQLVDLVCLGTQLDAGEWEQVLTPEAWWAAPSLSLADRLFPGRLPLHEMPAFQRAAQACPRRLQAWMREPCLDDVSASRWRTPWINGLAWAGSLAEVGTLVKRRVFPPTEHRAECGRLAAHQPWLTDTAWSRQTRWQRAARYLAGPPPRLQALYSVRLACDYTPPHLPSSLP